MGVSATHLDWTLAPYVRISFYKHFKDGVAYVEDTNRWEISQLQDDLLNWDAKNISIEDPRYTKYESAYDYAIDMTEREVHQAVEAMYHNLNYVRAT